MGGPLRDTQPGPLDGFSEMERSRGLSRYKQLRPFLEDRSTLAALARKEGISLRTARRWVECYRKHGLAGLARKARGDKGRCKVSPRLQHAIEGMALDKPPLSVAAIHRNAVGIMQDQPIPSGLRDVSVGSQRMLATIGERLFPLAEQSLAWDRRKNGHGSGCDVRILVMSDKHQ